VRKYFPIFQQRPNLIYLDNGATAQKPQCVLDAEHNFYTTSNSNIHRGPHFLAEEATVMYEDSRRTVADFIGAQSPKEIIFTRNATEAINLMARSYGKLLKEGDVIILSKLEHHANIIPWLQLKERKGIEIRYFDITEDGFIKFDPDLIDEKVKLVSITGMSNVLGTITNLKPIIKAAHAVDAKIMVDAAQLAVHQPTNVHELDIDFLTFTGHKLYGPTGIGVLYGKEELLNLMPPFLGGGDMVNEVYTDRFTPTDLPNKFEAGTPNIAGAVGLKAAIDYLVKIGFKKIHKIESELTKHLLDRLNSMPFIKIVGPTENKNRGPITSFSMVKSSAKSSDIRQKKNFDRSPEVHRGEDQNFSDNNIDDDFTEILVHPHDIAEGLSQKNICIRAGQHCAQPLMDACNLPATARISMAFYNTIEEVDVCCGVLEEIYDYFNK